MLNETELQEIENKWHEFGYIDADKVMPLLSTVRELQRQVADRDEVLADKRRLTRELDVAMRGEEGAAKQASLCDLIESAKKLRAYVGRLSDVAIDYVTNLGKAQGRLYVERQMVESLRREIAQMKARPDPLIEEQKRTIQSLMTGVEEHTGQEGTTPVLRYIGELEAKLKAIAEMTDGDNADSYRSDDREGCLDAVHAIASDAAMTKEQDK